MFGVKYQGRLGNHLFQWAFLLSTERRLGKVGVGFGHHSLDWLLKRPFRSRFLETHTRWVPTLVELPFQSDQVTYFELVEKHRYRDGVVYDGFFQSTAYFGSEVIARLRKQVRPEFLKREPSSTVLHFRRTDYQSFGNDELGGRDLQLPIAYYLEALQVAEVASHSDEICLVGDDQQFLASVKSTHFPSATLSSGSLDEDVRLMLNAKALIISNSTLAWWLAALNRHAPTVIAPRNWLGFRVGKEYPRGIELNTSGWTWIDVPTTGTDVQ